MRRPIPTNWPLAAAAVALLTAAGVHAQGFQSVSGATRPKAADVSAPLANDAAAHFESLGSSTAAATPTPVHAEAAPPAPGAAGIAATSPPGDASSAGSAPPLPDAAASAAAPSQSGTPAITRVASAVLPFSSVSAPPGGRSSTESGSGPLLPGGGDGSTASFDPADRIVIEKGARRLYLLRGESVLVEYPVRLGLNPYGHKQREGDFRTPEGTYYLSRRNPNSEFFLSVEVSYPNEADRARAREAGVRPGGLIMIHGQPNVPRKSPDYYANNDWTDGCIAVSNSDMVDIWQRTRLGIPIEIRP